MPPRGRATDFHGVKSPCWPYSRTASVSGAILWEEEREESEKTSLACYIAATTHQKGKVSMMVMCPF